MNVCYYCYYSLRSGGGHWTFCINNLNVFEKKYFPGDSEPRPLGSLLTPIRLLLHIHSAYVEPRGVATGGISVYIPPPKSVDPK